MSDHSAIQWTDATWNPVRGCTKINAGCKHCYAETFAERFRGVKGHPYERGFDVRLVPEALDLPLRWKKPRRVFVNSMSDLFHEQVPFIFIDQVFAAMAQARQHIYQVLTKRAARMHEWCDSRRGRGWELIENIWLGVSCEDQATADERIPHLLATPAAVRFVSAEPLLGPIDLRRYLGTRLPKPYVVLVPVDAAPPRGIDWVIIGGESGPRARPCALAWMRSLLAQCRAAAVPAFVKQLGSMPLSACDHFGVKQIDLGGKWEHVLRDRKGGDPSEWPADLRVREMPEVEP